MDRAGLLGLLVVLVGLPLVLGVPSYADVYVNVSNDTVYVKFENLTSVTFNKTILNIGWINSTHLACVYSCIYAHDPAGECHDVAVTLYDGTSPVATVVFNISENTTRWCPEKPSGLCYGMALFNVSGLENEARVMVVDLTTGNTSGPYVYEYPYRGPELTGYAKYIPIIVGVGVLFSIAGRPSMKNIGIGLVIFGLIAPVLTVLGAELTNIMLVSALSIIMGLLLIWFSNE